MSVWLCTYLDTVTCVTCEDRIKIGERMVKEADGRWRHLWPCPSRPADFESHDERQVQE